MDYYEMQFILFTCIPIIMFFFGILNPVESKAFRKAMFTVLPKQAT